ncbi:uncharacterized protein [Musca autumnalis]|uniref:uncharacterized protein n=1 Tax=Musca autumnalis TaxID=221902 RepID=UPI003CF9A90A
MRGVVVFCAVLAVVPVFGAQDGYKYREPAPVVEKSGLPTPPIPCTHGFTGYNFDEATKALINAQTQARIINKGHAVTEHNLETAASGYSPQIGTASQVVSGSFQSQSNNFVAGQGYTQGGVSAGQIPAPSVTYIPLSTGPQAPPQAHPITQIQPPLSAHSHTISSTTGSGASHSSFSSSASQQQQQFGLSASQQADGYKYQQGNNGGVQQQQQVHISQTFPPTGPAPQYKPLTSGPTSPGFGSGQYSSQFAGGQKQISGHYITKTPTNFAGQQQSTGQYASNFGSYTSSPGTFGGPHSYSSSGNFGGAQQGANFGAHSSSSTGNFGGAQQGAIIGAHSSSSTGNFGGAQQGANFGAHSSSSSGNFAGAEYASNFGAHSTSSSSLGNFGSQQQQHFSTSGPGFSSNYNSQHHGSSLSLGGNNQVLSTFSSSNLGANGLNGQLGSVIRETVAQAPLDPTAEKHIYVHIPPEDLDGDQQQEIPAPQFVAPPPKKHYKIVFIKAPTHPTPNYSQLAAAAAPKVEEKTLIYVLTKKPEEPSLQEIQQLTQDTFKSSKPEVYFIKYKTQKESDANSNVVNPAEIDLTNGGNDANVGIDIRYGGSVGGSSTSYTTSSSSISSSSSSTSESEGPRHELYGVPLQ